MSADTAFGCVVCGAATERFLCGDERIGSGCLGELHRQLGDCAALVDELNLVLARQSKTGGTSVGYVSNGGDEQPIPINLRAMAAGHWLRDRMCSWARVLWEDHAPREADGSIPTIDLQPGIIPVSRWLMRHPTWIALHPAADDLYAEITQDIKAAWRVAHYATPDTVYVGPCDAEMEGEACGDDLYARRDSATVKCSTCGTVHGNVRERQGVLAAAVEHQYVPLGTLVGLVTDRGYKVTTPIVRSLKSRKRVGAFVAIQDGDPGAGVGDRYGFLVRPWTKDDLGLPVLYRVGDVLDAITNRYKHTAA